jgi:hypothetical protein
VQPLDLLAVETSKGLKLIDELHAEIHSGMATG